MNFILTVHLKLGVEEVFLPGVNNRSISVPLNRDITKGVEVALPLEVFNGVWSIRPSGSVVFDSPKVFYNGLRIDVFLADIGEKAVILVEEQNLDSTFFKVYKVPQGVPITVGSGSDNLICYNRQNLVSGKHLCIEPSPGGYTLSDTSRNGSFLNWVRIHGKRQILRYGDVIFVLGLKIVWLGDVLAINNPAGGVTVSRLVPLMPAKQSADETPDADVYFTRSPRRLPKLDDEPIEIDPPPNPQEPNTQPLWMRIGPLITMVIPMSIGVIFTASMMQAQDRDMNPMMLMGIVTAATAAIVGTFWAFMNMRQQKRMHREKEEHRLQRYSEYLDRIEREISQRHANNRTVLCTTYPHVNTCMESVMWKDSSIWARNINHDDFLNIRMGMGSAKSPNPINVPKVRFSLVDDELAERPFVISKKFEMLTGVPVCLSLKEHNLVGIISNNREAELETARLFAAQVALAHSYTDVKMAFIVPKDENWGFAKWLPHVWSEDGSVRMVANDKTSVGEVLYSLTGVIRDRQDEDLRKSTNLPHYVVFVADRQLVEDEAGIKQIMGAGLDLGFTVLMFYDTLDSLPNNCTVIVQRDSKYSGLYSLDNAFPEMAGVTFDSITAHDIEETARRLSDIKVQEAEGAGAIPQVLTFLDMYKTSDVDGVDVYRNWLENRTYESMKAIIGQRGGGTPVFLDVHEKYHGPHGLVAGTTGSGKSEMLQSYILSLAVSYHPYEVSFILIDYKGGGMAESFKNLTHVAGIITNLGGNQTNRALESIRSEIKRRQAVFNDYRIKHIDNYIELFRAGKAGDPMPHLLIIADEFAELKKEQPEFVAELVSASRVGRSLGVHLILATQKPDGVVDDQIWSNTKFRVCLRVAEKADSMGMLKHPVAAFITQAGRGYFQVGNDEIFEEFQSGWSGAPYEPHVPFNDEKGAEVTLINLWGKPGVIGAKEKKAAQVSVEKQIQLDIVTDYIAKVAAQNNIKAISNVWLPPLPKQIYLDELSLKLDKNEIATLIGILDDPVNQEQLPVVLSFTQNNHVLVAGSVSGGKTTFIQTVLYGLVKTKLPEQLNIYIADYGSRTLSVFADLPHVGGVVFDDDPGLTGKLVTLLMKELNRRKLHFSSKNIGSFKEYSRRYKDVPAIVFAIDNMPAFMENNEQLEDSMIQMTREAAGYGIYLLVSCTNFGDIRGKLRQNFRFGVGLQLIDKFAYSEILGVRCTNAAEEGTPGRGLIKVERENQKESTPLEFQTAICLKFDEESEALNDVLSERFARLSSSWKGQVAPRIPQVPKDMSFEAFKNYPEVGQLVKGGQIPIGYDLNEATLVSIKPENIFCYAISGASRTGKTNTIQLVAIQAAAAGHDVYILDDAIGKLSSFAGGLGITFVNTADQIFELFNDNIEPEFARRNKLIGAAGGRKFASRALSGEKQIVMLIHDFGAFLTMIYEDPRDMTGFLEAMMKLGSEHKVAIFAGISRDDVTMHSSRPIFAGFVSWKEGIHLGGQTDGQRIFEFDLPYAERSKKLPPGMGHTMMHGATAAVITPEI